MSGLPNFRPSITPWETRRLSGCHLTSLGQCASKREEEIVVLHALARRLSNADNGDSVSLGEREIADL